MLLKMSHFHFSKKYSLVSFNPSFNLIEELKNLEV